ncbi:MAG: LEPR-XLL domain-containing protein, partial [Pirellulaceae bacterium]
MPAIPWYWFRRWFRGSLGEEAAPATEAVPLDAIVLEDRILYSASPLLGMADPIDPLGEMSPDPLAL